MYLNMKPLKQGSHILCSRKLHTKWAVPMTHVWFCSKFVPYTIQTQEIIIKKYIAVLNMYKSGHRFPPLWWPGEVVEQMSC